MPEMRVKVRTLMSIIFMIVNFSIIKALTVEQEIARIFKSYGLEFDTGIDNTFQTPNDDTFQAPNVGTFQAPNDDTFQTPNDETFQAPNDYTFQAPNVGIFQAPNDDTFQAPNNDTFQAPNDDTFQAPNDDTFSALNDGTFLAPSDDTFPASNDGTVQAPNDNTFQSPIDTFQYPKDNFQAPNVLSEESTLNPNTTPDSKDPCLEIFTSIFTKAVYSSETLSDLFNLINTTPSAFSKFLFEEAIDILLNSNIPNPEIIATSWSQPITENFDQLYLSLIVKVYGSAMAKFLFAEGVLNEWNAASLALAYAEEMRKEAIRSVVAGYPESKFKALSNGYKNFLKSFGLFVPEKFADFASGFGNETKLVGNQFGKGASFIKSS